MEVNQVIHPGLKEDKANIGNGRFRPAPLHPASPRSKNHRANI